jgi:hypothetical protein
LRTTDYSAAAVVPSPICFFAAGPRLSSDITLQQIDRQASLTKKITGTIVVCPPGEQVSKVLRHFASLHLRQQVYH